MRAPRKKLTRSSYDTSTGEGQKRLMQESVGLEYVQPLRIEVAPGDYGADPLGYDDDGVFRWRMVPSGDIVDKIEHDRRLARVVKRHHSTKKSPAQLQRDIDEELGTPAWARGLDLSESRALAQRLRVSQEELDAKERRAESDRRAALSSLVITEAGRGIFVRVSSPGPGYGKYHAVVDALKAFQIPIGNAIPPNIFVPVHKGADKTKVRTKVEEALRYAGYRA